MVGWLVGRACRSDTERNSVAVPYEGWSYDERVREPETKERNEREKKIER